MFMVDWRFWFASFAIYPLRGRLGMSLGIEAGRQARQGNCGIVPNGAGVPGQGAQRGAAAFVRVARRCPRVNP
jgi:hypothetical protein